MVTRTYDGTYADDAHASDTYAAERAHEDSAAYRDVGATIFLWVAWTLAFAVWAFFMSSFFGILHDVAAGGPGSIMGGVDLGGAAFAVMDVIGGVIVLGLVLIYGLAKYHTRNRALDPMTEAATARLYDQGGD
jgi:hypothetical protein